jgi:hypothetical protein
MCNHSRIWALRSRNTEFQSVFTVNYHFSIKLKAKPLCISSQNLEFLKTHKNLYIGPLCVTDPKFGLYDQEIRYFS